MSFQVEFEAVDISSGWRPVVCGFESISQPADELIQFADKTLQEQTHRHINAAKHSKRDCFDIKSLETLKSEQNHHVLHHNK